MFILVLLMSNFGFSQTRPSSVVVDTDQGDFGRTIPATNRSGNFLIPVTPIRLKDVDKSVLKENVLGQKAAEPTHNVGKSIAKVTVV